MLGRLAALMSGLALFACSTVGVRETPQPTYTVAAKLGDVEIRQYGPRVVAETVVAGDELDARDIGFRRLTGYISGANHGATQDAGTKIAKTAPVAQAREATGWRIRFFMPAGDTMQTLPVPDDKQVTLATVPPETMAVLRFSGSPTSQAVAAKTSDLVAALEGTAWRPAGAPVAWFYDLPGTLPPPRRNEVAIPVSPN